MINLSTILSGKKSLAVTRRSAIQLAATLPLVVCLLAAPYLGAVSSGNVTETSSGHTSGKIEEPGSTAPCEGLVPMLLGLAIYFSLHKLVFWLNPWFKAASPLNSQFEVGQLVAAAVGLAIVIAGWFLAHHQHVAAELSVAVAQLVILSVLFVILRRAKKLNHQVVEVFGHEVCSFAVLGWIIYVSAVQQGPGDVAPLMVGAAAVTHMNYAMYCLHSPRADVARVD